MKINIKNDNKLSQDYKGLKWKIIKRTTLVLVLLGIFFYIGVNLSEQIAESYLKSHFYIHLNSDHNGEKVEIPSFNHLVTLDLKKKTTDNYLDIRFSGGDLYKVEFLLDDKNDFILINTEGSGDQSFLYFIPENISNSGYKQIRIAPVRGDGDYWFQFINTHKDPDFKEFPNYKIIDFEIKKVAIEIGKDEFSKLQKKRDEALKLGILLTEDEDYVPAVIYGDGKKDKVELRLKGDWTDHLKEKKWSFRIKMNKECLWGMKEFSIHRPETRTGVGEYLIHAFYRNQGGVALRYDFVDVIINGEYWGVYALEEFFNKRLVENSLRREGPIIKPNENYMWERWAYYSHDYSTNLNFIEFDFFSKNKTLDDSTLSGYTRYAITLLNKLIEQEIEANEVFDMDIYARYLAASDIFYACHGNIWHNMRYYFNPITAKLEPITFDEEPTFGLCQSSSKKNDQLINPLFKDRKFISLYVHYLDKYLQEYDAFIESEQANLEQIAYIFQRDQIHFDDYSSVLDDYHEFIRSTLYADNNDFFIEQISDNEFELTIKKNSFLNIHIQEISYDGKSLNVDFSDYAEKIKIDKAKQNFIIGNLSKFEIIYQTFYDGQTHKEKAIVNSIELSFYVAGHVYGNPNKNNTPQKDDMHPPFVAALSDIAKDKRILFGILTGDTVYQPSKKSYENLIATMAKTEKPYFVVPGNHDLSISGLFLKYFKHEYQAFVKNKTLFVLLTPRQDWSIDDVQLKFLENELKEHKWEVSDILIFTHQLFWLEKNDTRFPGVLPNSWANKEKPSNFWSRIKPLFSNYPGGVYFFAGDVGASEDGKSVVYDVYDNLHFIATGMGGGVADNYLVVNVYSDSNVKIDLIALNGDNPNALGSLTDW